MSRSCDNCGAEVPARARYCDNCGMPVSSEAESSQEEVRTAPLSPLTPRTGEAGFDPSPQRETSSQEAFPQGDTTRQEPVSPSLPPPPPVGQAPNSVPPS